MLTKAITTGGQAVRGLKDLVTATGDISWEAVADDSGQAVLSLAKFVKDIEDAGGDQELKRLVTDLALRLQEVLVARGRAESASRRASLARAQETEAAATAAQYAQVYQRATTDRSVLRETAQTLLGVVRRYGDSMLREQFLAARAVEIYRRVDVSAAMAADRWRLPPDIELDYTQGFIDDAAYATRLALSETSIDIADLKAEYDANATPEVQQVAHYVTITDPARLTEFRQTLSTTFEVQPQDLLGDRYEALVLSAAVGLTGVTAAHPTFTVGLVHGGRNTYLLEDGTTLTQLLQPQRELITVATTGTPGTAVGAAAVPAGRIQNFWRRAIATQWRLTIEQDVVQRGMVDLTGLSVIRIAFLCEVTSPDPT